MICAHCSLVFISLVIAGFLSCFMGGKGRNNHYHLDRGFLEIRRKIGSMWR
ncbi:hypothetical protein [Bartonella rattimassiliensis]|uniref:hypothetical protein n=1 Tax=Bartonella rattimassiliensis TaxID=270250 RepID=UPI00030FC98B|nr:hypothetical protein [Bartonella rattimassiliensis]